METMQRILRGKEWTDLKEKLMVYVTNFQQDVVPSTGRFSIAVTAKDAVA